MVTLYPHQLKLVNDIFGAITMDRNILAIQPTGSGKTIEVIAIIGKLLMEKPRRIVVCTPQQHIEEGFTRRPYDAIKVGRSKIGVPSAMVRDVRSEGGIGAAILEYLQNPVQKHAIACTHAAVTGSSVFPPVMNLPDLDGSILFVDEAHHAPATGLNQFITAWLQANGQVAYFTATAFRSDGSPVMLHSNMDVFERSLPKHMKQGYAPKSFEPRATVVKIPASVTVKQMEGDEEIAKHHQKLIVKTMVCSWKEDGNPKTIVRIPSMRGGSGGMVDAVSATFRRAGARVKIVYGDDEEVKQEFLDMLRKERQVSYANSKFDVVIGSNRVMEGMDWPLASHYYNVGMPRNTPGVVQMLGRTMRKKDDRYPKKWRNKSVIQFFVPCGEGQVQQNIPVAAMQRMLVVCSYIDNLAAGREWAICEAIGRSISVPLGEGDLAESLEKKYPAIDDDLRAEAEKHLDDACKALPKKGIAPTDAAIYEWVVEERPTVSDAVIRQVLMERIVTSEEVGRERAERLLIEAIEERLFNKDGLRTALLQAFKHVWDEFEGETFAFANSCSMVQQAVELTGDKIEVYAKKLGKSRPLRPARVRRAVNEHRQKYNTDPTSISKERPLGDKHETWKDIDHSIEHNKRKWPIADCRGLPDFIRNYVTNGMIRDIFLDFCRSGYHDKRILWFVTHFLETPVQGLNTCVGELTVSKSKRKPDLAKLQELWWKDVVQNVQSGGLDPTSLLYVTHILDHFSAWYGKAAFGLSTAHKRQAASILTHKLRVTVPRSSRIKTSRVQIMLRTGKHFDVGVSLLSPPSRSVTLIDGFGNAVSSNYMVPLLVSIVGGKVKNIKSMKAASNKVVLVPVTWIDGYYVDREFIANPANWLSYLRSTCAEQFAFARNSR